MTTWGYTPEQVEKENHPLVRPEFAERLEHSLFQDRYDIKPDKNARHPMAPFMDDEE